MYMNKFERIECQPKRSISDNDVGYTPNMEGYATFMSDIPELYEIARISR